MKRVVINKQKVQPIQKEEVPIDKIKGNELFPCLYNNIFICARKNSGKTTLIFNIIKQCCDKYCTVIVFSGTHYSDSSWQYIKDYMKYKKIPSMFFDSINNGKINQLEEVISDIKAEDIPDDKEPSEQEKKSREEIQKMKDVQRILGNEEKDEKKKERKPKKICPKYLIIFDDLSSELRSKSVDMLLKTNRHMKARVIISSQWINDLLPGSRRQIGTYILYGGHSEEKMLAIYENADLPISFEKFMELYKDATAEKYNFLYVDSHLGEFRRNFNEKYDAK